MRRHQPLRDLHSVESTGACAARPAREHGHQSSTANSGAGNALRRCSLHGGRRRFLGGFVLTLTEQRRWKSDGTSLRAAATRAGGHRRLLSWSCTSRARGCGAEEDFSVGGRARRLTSSRMSGVRTRERTEQRANTVSNRAGEPSTPARRRPDQLGHELDRAARPDIRHHDINASSISSMEARVASTWFCRPLRAALRRGRLDDIRLEVDGHDARRPTSSAHNPSTRAPQPDEQPLIRATQLFEHQHIKGVLRKAPNTDLDQPRHVPAIVLGPRKAHAEPNVSGRRVARPRLEGGARASGRVTATIPSARSVVARTSLPLVIHGYEYQTVGHRWGPRPGIVVGARCMP